MLGKKKTANATQKTHITQKRIFFFFTFYFLFFKHKKQKQNQPTYLHTYLLSSSIATNITKNSKVKKKSHIMRQRMSPAGGLRRSLFVLFFKFRSYLFLLVTHFFFANTHKQLKKKNI